jgi:tetratricopeptide (TPR) repeat protein
MESTNPMDSFDIDELVALARLDLDKGALSEALWKLKKVVASDNPPAEALSMVGRLYAQLGLWARAQQMFRQYIAIEPSAINENFQLGMVHFDAGQSAEALKIWEGLLKNHPTHPPALFYRALLSAEANQMAEARHSLEILLKSAPADNLYFKQGKELLESLDARQAMANATPAVSVTKEGLVVSTKDFYRTEH